MLIRKIGICEDVTPTLYLHGLFGDGRDWLSIATKNAIIIDLPERDIDKTILQILPQEKCHLVGYSMGGRIAMRLKVRYPNRFDKAVIISAHPGLAKMEREERVKIDSAREEEIRERGLQQFLKNWYNSTIFSSLRTRNNFLEILARREEQNSEKMAALLVEESVGKQESYWGKLHGMHFLFGALDEKYRPVYEQVLNTCAKAELLEDVGHALHLEDPERVRKKLETILYG